MPKSAEVEAWLARYDNPMKAVLMRIREHVLAADPRIGECIKWQAPTFTYEGNLASFYPKSKAHASLMFHAGARIPGDHPRLEGDGDTSRVMKIGSVAEADAARADITAVVRAWCAWKDGGAAKKPVAKKPAVAKRPAAKKPAANRPAAKRR